MSLSYNKSKLINIQFCSQIISSILIWYYNICNCVSWQTIATWDDFWYIILSCVDKWNTYVYICNDIYIHASTHMAKYWDRILKWPQYAGPPQMWRTVPTTVSSAWSENSHTWRRTKWEAPRVITILLILAIMPQMMFSSKAAIISDCLFISIWFCWKERVFYNNNNNRWTGRHTHSNTNNSFLSLIHISEPTRPF